MFLLCCCGDRNEPVGGNSVHETDSEPVDGPVVIEPLPDVSTLQLAHPSALPEKPAPPPQRNWQLFDEAAPQKVIFPIRLGRRTHF